MLPKLIILGEMLQLNILDDDHNIGSSSVFDGSCICMLCVMWTDLEAYKSIYWKSRGKTPDSKLDVIWKKMQLTFNKTQDLFRILKIPYNLNDSDDYFDTSAPNLHLGRFELIPTDLILFEFVSDLWFVEIWNESKRFENLIRCLSPT